MTARDEVFMKYTKRISSSTMSMHKKTVVLVVSGIVVAIALATAWYLAGSRQSPVDSLVPASAYGTDNPLEKKPDLNPADKTNPFANIKTNPFE